MLTIRPQILDRLCQEKAWYLRQIQRIDTAIQILQAEEDPFPSVPIRWTAEIRNIFQSHDNLLPSDVIQYLIDKGIIDVTLPTRRMNVYATLAQMVKDGVLEKTAEGRYKKKTIEAS